MIRHDAQRARSIDPALENLVHVAAEGHGSQSKADEERYLSKFSESPTHETNRCPPSAAKMSRGCEGDVEVRSRALATSAATAIAAPCRTVAPPGRPASEGASREPHPHPRLVPDQCKPLHVVRRYSRPVRDAHDRRLRQALADEVVEPRLDRFVQ
jgi:hypothetical protein